MVEQDITTALNDSDLASAATGAPVDVEVELLFEAVIARRATSTTAMGIVNITRPVRQGRQLCRRDDPDRSGQRRSVP